MKYLLSIILVILFSQICCAQENYKFDSLAKVNGCGYVSLQKISKDLKYELIVYLKIDSLPINQELDIKKYSKFVKVYMNKYGKENKYINGICDDLIFNDPDAKEPIKYELFDGIILVKNRTSKYKIFATLKNIILKNKSNETLFLSSEIFDSLFVGWVGG